MVLKALGTETAIDVLSPGCLPGSCFASPYFSEIRSSLPQFSTVAGITRLSKLILLSNRRPTSVLVSDATSKCIARFSGWASRRLILSIAIRVPTPISIVIPFDGPLPPTKVERESNAYWRVTFGLD
jgi:hypothetical protein